MKMARQPVDDVLNFQIEMLTVLERLARGHRELADTVYFLRMALATAEEEKARQRPPERAGGE